MNFQTREQIIKEYLSNIDFTSDKWSIKAIKKDLKSRLGEEPAVNVKYKKDVMLSEFNSEAKEITVIDEIQVFYSPELDKEFNRVSFKIGA